MGNISAQRVFEIFKELNNVPRPSHHEEKAADFLCRFAERLGLDYERDAENCVVIRKPATPGHENAETIVLLNHMDMVCVGMADPLNDPIIAVEKDGWLTADGTSLGADNGVGLAMALAVLENNDIVHGPLEVITTTNEEDGMSGAAHLSPDFIKGRKVINLDSEDYDTITTGAAGACLQIHKIPLELAPAPNACWQKLIVTGGKGGHSGVDINLGRCSSVTLLMKLLEALKTTVCGLQVASITAGEANASIASTAEIIVCFPDTNQFRIVNDAINKTNIWLNSNYGEVETDMKCFALDCEPQQSIINDEAIDSLLKALKNLPQGVVEMSSTMPGTVETSNNIGRIYTTDGFIIVSTHTRSFDDKKMKLLSKQIAHDFEHAGAASETVMAAPAWQEDQNSQFLKLTSDTFLDTLGWRPRMVAMHFVLEAGFFVMHYPGIQIASIGPRILQPHSTSERVEIVTINDIWNVLINLLERLA